MRLSFMVVALTLALVTTVEAVTPVPEECPGCLEPPLSLGEVLGINVAPGALVLGVKPDSPAEASGLALCDLIVSFNGNSLRNYAGHGPFLNAMREAGMLSRASLDVWKYDTATETRSLTTAELQLPAQLGAKAGLATAFQILVLEVRGGSAAERADIRPGDMIEKINGKAVAAMQYIIDADLAVSDAMSQDGKVQLTLSRWKPVPQPSTTGAQTTFSSRDVTVDIGTN